MFAALPSLKPITNHAVKVVAMQCLNRIYTYGGAWHQGGVVFHIFLWINSSIEPHGCSRSDRVQNHNLNK